MARAVNGQESKRKGLVRERVLNNITSFNGGGRWLVAAASLKMVRGINDGHNLVVWGTILLL